MVNYPMKLFDVNLEGAVLSALMIEEDTKTLTKFRPEYFYDRKHRAIFETIKGMYENNEVIDLATVRNKLEQQKKLEYIGGTPYLSEISDIVLSTAHLKDHAKIVKDYWKKRQILKNIDVAKYKASSGDDITEIIENIKFEDDSEIDSVSLNQMILENKEFLEKIIKKEYSDIVRTGYSKMDKLIEIEEGNLIVIASRVSVGKTAFSLNLARNMARLGFPVKFYSFEMTSRRLALRLQSNYAKVQIHRWTANRDIQKVIESDEKLYERNLPIYFDDFTEPEVKNLFVETEKEIKENKISVVIIDHLHLMRGEKGQGKVEELGSITAGLKKMAKRLNIPIILLAQLNRMVELRKTNEPILADLRSSGAIEQDADIVIFLWKEKDEPEILQWKVAKNREGGLGEGKLSFKREISRIENIEDLPF